ncbi:MAG: 3-oxoacyl-[acyl-carrier-protein] reductase [Bdellovibrionales bacterium]
MSDLKNLSYFVTGGSRGIGRAIVQTLAQSGARVAFSYASQESVAQEVLKSLPGEGHFVVPLRLEDPSSIEQAVEAVLEKMPQPSGLVNNAGLTRDNLMLRMKVQDWDDVLNSNLRGTFLVTQGFLKSFLKARQGSIVNVASVIGRIGNAGQANYAASKAGLIGFSKSLAREIGSRGIRVNCVAPGFIKTDMTKDLPEMVQQQLLSQIPLGYLAEPDDVAHAVKFLLSPESRYITGHTLDVNGGMFMN